MDPELQQAKRALRQAVAAQVAALTPAQREAAGAAARARLERQPAWREARSVLFFAPLPGELDLWPLLADALGQGKRAALPRYDAAARAYEAREIVEPGRDLCHGKFGIREPASHCALVGLNRLDFILVPGVAFDLHGRRLGRGKGYYDRLLAAVRGITCGVAFDEQMVEQVPVEPHDRFVNCILTPTRWVERLPARGLK